ncbi:iron-containing alcohol dehydrogenase [uncultured Faecalicoccus sp.]|uniref:iron-containing alcohol dehydrogenase n=1 Tax=uncultured Faecalicoccus sp. TaxID=1971760 RepID=UPI0025E4C6D6|nr:iron-containing alcohol dehydrogenase [uncultured Faecalicoccus sp.]
MNPIQKTYCRIYQNILHLALPFLPYRKPEILPSIFSLSQLFRSKQIDTVLLITDQSIRSFGLCTPLEKDLEDNGIRCVVYDKTVPNPTSDNVEEALAFYHQHHCQALIGFGGGSSIDCAKATGARIARPHKSLAKMEGILKVLKKIPPLVAIPTTAGTGSETTLAAVIVDSRTRHKYPINDFPLIPRYAVLDPYLTKTLPASLTATTGMDALTHAVEAYIGNSTTKETRTDATQAIALIFMNLAKAVNDPGDLDARKNMLEAAFLAGNAFSQSYVGYVHAIAHSLGGKYNIPHGYANAVILPMILEAYGDKATKKLAELALVSGASRDPDEKVRAQGFINAIKTMKKTFGIPDTFKEIQEQDIPYLAAQAAKEANPLYPVPLEMNAKELETYYRTLMEDHDGNK